MFVNVYSSFVCFPGCGYRSVRAHLQSIGLNIRPERVRLLMFQVDPDGVLFRRHFLQVTQRRSYHVRAPLCLWHIDGYHKLIR